MATPNALVTVLTLAVALLPINANADSVVVTFTIQDAEVVLSESDQYDVAERVRALIVGCSITSLSDPAIFSGRTLAREWQELRAGSHLYVRFPQPLQSQRSALKISEVVIGFDAPGFIGPELTRHADEVVGHTKCDGHRSLALMCAPALRPHLLAGQEANCSVYDRIGEPR